MQISSCYTVPSKTLPKSQTKQSKATTSQIAFKSIFADAKPNNMMDYMAYMQLMQLLGDTGYVKIKSNSTRIFREHISQLALAKYLDSNEKTQIKVLGCSDGSEAYAYAIAMKEIMGEKGKENVKILAVDNQPYMIALAQTGKLVCSDIEKDYANNQIKGTTPLTGAGWDKHLQKTSRPEIFPALMKKYPLLAYVETDPVARKTINNGLNWYTVNKENLPNITFQEGDLFDYLHSTDNVKNEVYVIANTAGYMLEKSADEYIKIFKEIQQKNKDKNKNVFVIIGDLELNQLNPKFNTFVQPSDKIKIKQAIKNLGFVNLSESELKDLNVTLPAEASSKIYKLC